MTNLEIKSELSRLVEKEKGLTVQILNLIQVGLRQRSYLEFGFSSMFDWLTRGFGYSNAAAYRRIEAARISLSVPEVAEKLEKGKLNLSSLCALQTAIKNEQKASGEKVTVELKRQLIEKIESKPQPEVERVIVEHFPSAQLFVRQDRRVRVDASTVRLSVNISDAVALDLQRAKEILSHKLPQSSDAEVLAEVLKFFLEKKDPLRKVRVVTSAAEVKRRLEKPNSTPRVSPRLRREILQKSGGCCSYRNPITGEKCESRYQIGIDHLKPRAKGGTNETSNLRALCRPHNLMMAEQILGAEVMARYRHMKL